MKPVILNLGCGKNILPDTDEYMMYNIDFTLPCDVVGNIYHLPFKSNSIQTIVITHVLEHIWDIQLVKKEMARVLKSKTGAVQIVVPHYLSPDAYGDPTHIRQFSHHSFFNQYWPGFIPMRVLKQKQTIPESYQPLPGLTVEEDAMTSVWNVIMQRTSQPYEAVVKEYEVEFVKDGCSNEN